MNKELSKCVGRCGAQVAGTNVCAACEYLETEYREWMDGEREWERLVKSLGAEQQPEAGHPQGRPNQPRVDRGVLAMARSVRRRSLLRRYLRAAFLLLPFGAVLCATGVVVLSLYYALPPMTGWTVAEGVVSLLLLAVLLNPRKLRLRPRAAWGVLLCGATLACAALSANGQALPEAPRPHLSRVTQGLMGADVAIRSLDLVSTSRLLNAPCHCFRESDPLAPRSGALLPQLAFQGGMAALAVLGSHRLEARGHRRMARMLLLADIASEVWAVQGNYRARWPQAVASVAGIRPRPLLGNGGR